MKNTALVPFPGRFLEGNGSRVKASPLHLSINQVIELLRKAGYESPAASRYSTVADAVSEEDCLRKVS